MPKNNNPQESALQNLIDSCGIQYFTESISDTYKSWIPTNTGKLLFKYIGNEITISSDQRIIKDSNKKEIIFFDFRPQISDKISFGLKEVWKFFPDQDVPVIMIKLKKEEKRYTGTVSISFFGKNSFKELRKKIEELHNVYIAAIKNKVRDEAEASTTMKNHSAFLEEFYKEYETNESTEILEHLKAQKSSMTLSGSLTFEEYGEVVLENISLCCMKIENYPSTDGLWLTLDQLNTALYDTKDANFSRDGESLALSLYTAIKRLAHRDNHHDAKLDTFIGVYKENVFSVEKVLLKMQSRIKEIEAVLKREHWEPEKGYAEKAKGIFSYMKSLCLIYDNRTGGECSDFLKQKMRNREIVAFTESLIDSIDSVSARLRRYQSCPDYAKGIIHTSLVYLLTLAGIILAFFKAFGGSIEEFAEIIIAVSTVVAAVAAYNIIGHKPCMFRNIFYRIAGRERYLVIEHKYPIIKKTAKYFLIIAATYAVVSLGNSVGGISDKTKIKNSQPKHVRHIQKIAPHPISYHKGEKQ